MVIPCIPYLDLAIYYASAVTLEIWISFLPYDYTYEPENIYICSGEDSCSNFVALCYLRKIENRLKKY